MSVSRELAAVMRWSDNAEWGEISDADKQKIMHIAPNWKRQCAVSNQSAES